MDFAMSYLGKYFNQRKFNAFVLLCMSRRHVDTHTYERNIGHVDTQSLDKGCYNVPLHFQSVPNYVAGLGLYQKFSKLFAQPNNLLQLSGESAEISK